MIDRTSSNGSLPRVLAWITESPPRRDGKILVRHNRVILPGDDDYKALS